MKRLILLFISIASVLTCNAQKSKSFYFDGIEMHNVKGWDIQPAKSESHTTIHCSRNFGGFQTDFLEITKQKIVQQNHNIERYLEQYVERTSETNFNTTGKRSPRIKEIGEMMDGYINAMPAKYVDIKYTMKISQRIYALQAHNCLYTINCFSGAGSIDSRMGKILSTLTLTPETNTNRLY